VPDQVPSDLGKAVSEVAEKAQLLVREEIALAKAEMTEKITGLIKGAVVGAIAAVFAIFGLIYLLHGVAWLIWMLLRNDNGDNQWIGYGIVAVVLFLLGAVSALLAVRFLKKSSPPTPQMAIEEGKLIRETLKAPHPATPEGPAGAIQAPNPSRTEVGAR
jgi:uncharacterized membrane protein YqjE